MEESVYDNEEEQVNESGVVEDGAYQEGGLEDFVGPTPIERFEVWSAFAFSHPISLFPSFGSLFFAFTHGCLRIDFIVILGFV